MSLNRNGIKLKSIEACWSATSETDIVEGRVVNQKSTIISNTSFQSANSFRTFGAVIAPVASVVANSIDIAIVGAHETNVVDGRVIGRVARWTDT